MLKEHNEQVSQLSDQLHEKDLQIKQYETELQVSVYVCGILLFFLRLVAHLRPKRCQTLVLRP